jgi:hypothetical protein
VEGRGGAITVGVLYLCGAVVWAGSKEDRTGRTTEGEGRQENILEYADTVEMEGRGGAITVGVL